MPESDTIYVKVVVSYGKPTEFDDVGCDGLYIQSTEICTKEITALKRVKNGLLWLNNNIHNYGSDEFLGYLQDAIQDALPSKDSG